MAWRNWDPFREMDLLRREIDRVFDGYGRGSDPQARFSFLPGRSARAYPLVNVSQDADNLLIEALAPGVNPDTIQLSVLGSQLTITGEKTAVGADTKSEAWHRSERAAGKFIRTIELPVAVEDKQVEAEYRNGLLTITLPKAEAAKPKQIEIKVQG